jgi:hypothetical protein
MAAPRHGALPPPLVSQRSREHDFSERDLRHDVERELGV